MHKVMWVIWWINIIIYNYTIAHQLTLITVIYTQTYIYAYMPDKNTTNNETFNFGHWLVLVLFKFATALAQLLTALLPWHVCPLLTVMHPPLHCGAAFLYR